jgi:hypothetical protein
MPKFAYQANLTYRDGRLIGTEGEFPSAEVGAAALDALLADLKARHANDGEVPQVTVFHMHPAPAE